MHREVHICNLSEAADLIYLQLGHFIGKYNLPILGTYRNGVFWPEINPFPFMRAMIESYFETTSSALAMSVGSAYPQVCFSELSDWGIPPDYWNWFCREVFNAMAINLKILPPVIPYEKIEVESQLTESFDLIYNIYYHD